MKKRFPLLAAVLLAALLSGCFLLPKESTAPELPLVTPYNGAEYLTAAVVRGDIICEARVFFTCNPVSRADLRFEVPDRKYGVICVSVGDKVNAGDLLAELDSAAERDAIRQTETELRRLRIRLDAAREALRIAEEEEVLRGGLSAVASDARRADVSYYEAAIGIRERRLAEQNAELESLRLLAPMDGTVTYVRAIDQNSRSNRVDTVVSIADGSSSIFTARTGDYALFRAGETYTVIADGAEYRCLCREPEEFGMSGEVFKGDMKNVCLAALDGDLPDGGVRGEVRLQLDVRENVHMLPVRAVFTVGGRSYVYCEDESGLKTAKEIACGLSNGSWIEITDGLEEGDHVIVS